MKRVITEGGLVVTHSCVHQKPGDTGVAAVHIFRFEKENIAELWDVIQPVPESSPNQNGMFQRSMIHLLVMKRKFE